MLRQSFSVDEYEIICIDDCSSDNSYQILQEYEKKYKQVRCLQNSKNSGVSITRNNGLKLARGKYITFIDSDDMIADEIYPRVVKLLEENSCGVATWDYGCRMNKSFHSTLQTITFEKKAAVSLIEKVGMVCMLMVEKQIVDYFQLTFAPNVSYAEDNLFCYLLFLSQKEIPVIHINEKAYFYRIVEGSLSKENQNSIIWFCKLSLNMKLLALWLKDYLCTYNNLFDNEQILLIKKRLSIYTMRSIYNSVKGKNKNIISLAKELTDLGIYPYRIKFVIRPLQIENGIKNIKTIAMNLVIALFNNYRILLIISKLWKIHGEERDT